MLMLLRIAQGLGLVGRTTIIRTAKAYNLRAGIQLFNKSRVAR